MNYYYEHTTFNRVNNHDTDLEVNLLGDVWVKATDLSSESVSIFPGTMPVCVGGLTYVWVDSNGRVKTRKPHTVETALQGNFNSAQVAIFKELLSDAGFDIVRREAE